MKTAKFITGVLAASLLMIGSLAYAGIAGKVQYASGSVQLVGADGTSRALRKGGMVNESDTVTTGKRSTTQIRMVDGGLIAVRPESELKIDNYVFNGKQDGNEKAFFRLLRGGMRAITGLVGQQHKANYRITTPTATIGIRGTDHETYVVLAGSELAATVPPGTYNKVNVGGTTLTTEMGSINIQPNQMGYAGAPNQMPQLQPINLNLFTVAPATGAQGRAQADVRASAVVDSGAVQGQVTAPQGGTAVQQNGVRAPIKGTYGGVTAPPQTVIF